MPGPDSVSPPSEERLSNRDRRPAARKSARAPFPLITAKRSDDGERRAAAVREADLDTGDPAAGGGRGFSYEWEKTAQNLHEEIQTVASGGGVSYTHQQTVPAATWVIDHHMGLIPNIVILDNSGQQMIAEIRHPSDQTCVVVHSAPYTGTAYLRP